MGMGTFSGGKFDLIVSIRHDADAARLAEWQASFERASKILFDATDGQHQFGTIYVCNNSTGSQRADSWLHEEDGQSGSPYLGLGAAGLHQMIFGDERFKPYILIHEFGHYAYDLGDEYVGPLDRRRNDQTRVSRCTA